MQYTWRCQKCFRYLSNIEVNSQAESPTTQRTICPRCKSENKITLNARAVMISCGFSRNYNSNLTNSPASEAPDTKTALVEKSGSEYCLMTKIVIIKNKKDSN